MFCSNFSQRILIRTRTRQSPVPLVSRSPILCLCQRPSIVTNYIAYVLRIHSRNLQIALHNNGNESQQQWYKLYEKNSLQSLFSAFSLPAPLRGRGFRSAGAYIGTRYVGSNYVTGILCRLQLHFINGRFSTYPISTQRVSISGDLKCDGNFELIETKTSLREKCKLTYITYNVAV